MKYKIVTLIVLLTLITLGLSACTESSASEDRSKIHVGIVFDIEPGTPNAIEPAMRAFAERHFDLIIGVGFAQAPIMEQVAKDYPNIQFAIIDGVSNLPNVASSSSKNMKVHISSAFSLPKLR